jgi:hypothetical protein
MVITSNKKFATFVLLVGVVCVLIGGFFVYQGISKSNLVINAMRSENITYGGAGGDINGIIDTSAEAATMAAILNTHSHEQFGNYSQLKRDDPNRQQILNAMTMQNALNLAVMGSGVAEMAEGTGGFMLIIGLSLVAGGAIALRPSLIK